MERILNNWLGAIAAAATMTVASPAAAADYNWTGLAGNCLWSDANNWTNEAGAAVAPASSTSQAYSYSFTVGDSGLCVTQDISGTILVNQLTIANVADNAATIQLVSKANGYLFDFSANAVVDVPAGATLVWAADADRWANQQFSKNGAGKLVFDLRRSPQAERIFNLNAGTAEIAATSADTRFHVVLSGKKEGNLPQFRNLKEGSVVGALDSAYAGGKVLLGDTTLCVGAPLSALGSTNVLPAVEGDGRLVFQNERVTKIVSRVNVYDMALDRADVILSPLNTVVRWLFENPSNAREDTLSAGGRMSVTGSPSVVNDEVRGSVLSFSDGAYFCGPDENTWLNDFDPSSGYTVAFWIKPDANGNKNGKILFLGASQDAQALAIRLNDSETQNLMVTCWGSNQTPDTGNLCDGWHHIAVTYSGRSETSGDENNMCLYIDGGLVCSWRVWQYRPQKKDLYIGNVAGSAWGYAGSGSPYTGRMDDFCLCSGCLSAADIARLKSDGAAAYFDRAVLCDVEAKSAGTLVADTRGLSLKTLSGAALAGGIETACAGSVVSVGTPASSGMTEYKGVLRGANATLVKDGADYALALGGTVPAVTNLAVRAGTLALRRPLARAGLVVWYPFDDAGDLSFDASPAGLALVNTNASTALAWTPAGAGNGAADFPGDVFLSSGRGAFPSGFPRGNGSFTVSVWIKPTVGACTGSVPIFSWGSGSEGQMCMVRFNGGNGINFTTYGSSDDLVAGGLTLSDGKWHHLVAAYDGSSRKKTLYFDGQLQAEKTLTGNLDLRVGRDAFEIGHTSVISSRLAQFYTGGMDELMIFDYAWDAGEVAAEFNRDAPAAVASESLLPTPVAHWTFDGENPLSAESGDAALELAAASGEVAYESGDAICGKAARFSADGGFLKLATFPSGVIPAGNSEFTVVVRYRPDTHGGAYNAHIVGWGNSDGYDNGSLFRMASAEYGKSAQALFRGSVLEADGTARTSQGNERTRWYTVAAVYQSPGCGSYTGSTRLYIDGELKAQSGIWSEMVLPEQNFAIGDCVEGTRRFYGLVDDVQIYDRVLSAGQLRMISEQFEMSKGCAATGASVSQGVLTTRPDVSVAQGTTLRVESVETIANLSGAGTIEIAPLARLNVASVDGFTGTVTGSGLVGVADGAVLDFGDGTSPLLVLDRPLALGANVTVGCTAKSGRLLLARAASFADAANLETWTAALPGGRVAKFKIANNGTELYLCASSPLMIIVR